MKLINIPNIITCCNLLCGCFAILFGLQGELGIASILIIMGAVFDFFDGLTARALHISGPIGKELDSLADVVTFGIAPSVLAYQIVSSFVGHPVWLSYACFIMAACSALRLAKFNCDERQHLSFIGLPTPANAIFWIGLVYVNKMHLFVMPYTYLVILLIFSYLLICEIPMFSLKLKPGHNGFAENKARYIFLIGSIIIAIVLTLCGAFCTAPAAIILLYILLSLFVYKA